MNNQNHIDRLDSFAGNKLTIDELNEIEAIFEAHPDSWERYGEISDWIQDNIIRHDEKNTVEYQSTIEGLAQYKESLLEDGDSAIERIAVEQILTNHLQVAKTGMRLETIQPKPDAIAEAKFWTQAHNNAHARLLRSMTHLIRIRKATAEYKLKLWQNRPLSYDRLDYFNRTDAEIDARRQEVRAERDQQQSKMKKKKETENIEAEPEADIKPLSPLQPLPQATTTAKVPHRGQLSTLNRSAKQALLARVMQRGAQAFSTA